MNLINELEKVEQGITRTSERIHLMRLNPQAKHAFTLHELINDLKSDLASLENLESKIYTGKVS